MPVLGCKPTDRYPKLGIQGGIQQKAPDERASTKGNGPLTVESTRTACIRYLPPSVPAPSLPSRVKPPATQYRLPTPRGGEIAAQVLGQPMGDLLERFIDQLPHGRVAGCRRIVELHLVFALAQRLAPVRRFLKLPAISISSLMTWAVSIERFW